MKQKQQIKLALLKEHKSNHDFIVISFKLFMLEGVYEEVL